MGGTTTRKIGAGRETDMQKTDNSAISAIAYVLAWFACSVLLIADVLIVRQAALDVMTAAQQQAIENSPEGEKAVTRINAGFMTEIVDRAIIILGGVAAVGLAIYFEHYFRKGREQGILYQRIGRVFGILAAVLVIAMVVQTVV
jgi:hypothetical protein